MPLNVIFPTETNFPVRSRYLFSFMFSLTFKAFMMFVTFLLFQSNLYVVLARGKGPKNNVHRDLFKTKNPKQKNPQTPSCVLRVLGAWIGLQPNVFPKCLKDVIIPNFLVYTLICRLKSFSKFPRKHLCWSLVFNKVAG